VGGLTTDPAALAESTWWDSTAGAGGGGGKSTVWPIEQWQADKNPGETMRLVPDISLEADPASGLQIFAPSQPNPPSSPSWMLVGGTSLAAPLAAATMTDQQILDGAAFNYGRGNIAPELYAAPASSFRDTTTGTNGFYAAGSGYDLATGLGAPLWSAILGHPILSLPSTVRSLTIPVSVTVPVGMTYTGYSSGVGFGTEPVDCTSTSQQPAAPTSLLAPADGPTAVWVMGYLPSTCVLSEAWVFVDTHAPTVSAPTGSVVPIGGSTMTWAFGGSDPAPSSGLRYAVTVVRADNHARVWTGMLSTPRLVLHGLPGVAYVAAVRAIDAAGNMTGIRYGRITMPLAPAAFAHSSGWVAKTDSGAVTHRSLASLTRSSWASLRTSGSSFTLYGLAGPTAGLATVYVDGHKVSTWNLYSATNRPGSAIRVATFSTVGLHTVRVVVLGTHVSRSKGSTITLEGLLASR
jgi:hypothetical protein